MTRQEKARIRNWNKARIMGLTFNTDGFSKKELETVKYIYVLRDELLVNWDKNSVQELGMSSKNYKNE